MKIPLCIPDITEKEVFRVVEVLKSGWLAHGPVNKEFEESFAKFVGTKHAVSFNSWTSAAHVLIEALGLKGEIIVPSFTMSATANVVVTAGCTPVFADIDWKTCNLNIDSVKSKITDKTVAIMPVHYAGQSCEMDKLQKICKEHGLKLLEDSAETLGGTFEGKKTGSFGIGIFSFFPTKNITCGEGGMITTDDDELAEKLKTLRGHGIPTSTFDREKEERPWFRASTHAGYNMRLSDVLAAIGTEQLKRIEELNSKRIKHAAYLTAGLKDVQGLEVPFEQEKATHVYQMYTIKLAEGIDRTKFIMALREKGIGANVHFDPPTHLQRFYTENFGCKKGDLPVTEEVAERIVTLPMYPRLKKEELDYIIESVKALLAQK